MKQPVVKAFDFFCGAGGLTRGLLDAGIDVLAGIDFASALKDTYQKNNHPSLFFHSDVNSVDILELRRDFNVTKDDIVLYAACAPCQPFSTLNRTGGKDERKELLLVFAEKILKVAPPDFIVVENVPGLNNAYGKDISDAFSEILVSLGFKTENTYRSLLDAKDFGVPQTRKRFILMASRHGRISPPQKAEQIKTVADAIKALPPLADGEKSETFPNHEAKALIAKHKTIIQAVRKNGGSRSDVKDKSILLPCHQRHPTAHKDVFGRMKWDAFAPTLTCRCTDVYCGRFVHPEQDRGISLREAAALQSFSDDYKFYGNFAQVTRQIGNAVPVELAKRIGQAIISSNQ